MRVEETLSRFNINATALDNRISIAAVCDSLELVLWNNVLEQHGIGAVLS